MPVGDVFLWVGGKWRYQFWKWTKTCKNITYKKQYFVLDCSDQILFSNKNQIIYK